jgi:hypothetical protein
MFFPPSMNGLFEDRPTPRPVYDNPPVIVQHRPVRALVARLAARSALLRCRTREECPEPSPVLPLD